MSRLKMLLLGLAISLAAALGGASTALALPEYIVQNVPLDGAVEAKGTAGTAEIKTKIAGHDVAIYCNTNTFSEGSLEAAGKSKGKFAFTACTLYEEADGTATAVAGCTVANFEFRFKDNLLARVAEVVPLDEFKPNAGTSFVEISITGGTCPAAYAEHFKLEGAYVAQFDAQISRQTVYHAINFSAIGTGMTFGNATRGVTRVAFYFNINQVNLEGSKPWYARY